MKNALEIILSEEIQNIFDHFAASFGIVIVFYSLDGKILRRGLNQPVSGYCRLVQNNLYGSGQCSLSDESRCRECTEQRRIVSYRCHAGIEEAVAPIYIDNQIAGYAMIGQFRCENKPDAAVINEAGKAGIRTDLEQAFQLLPYYDSSRKKHLLGLFEALVDYIITKEMVSVKGERITGQVMGYIEQNINRPLRLSEAARAVGRSCSSVSHAFTASLGKSFSQVVIETKLKRAEDYFRNSPELSVSEVAERLGYKDPLYFSRIYRKYRGFPPSKFIDTK